MKIFEILRYLLTVMVLLYAMQASAVVNTKQAGYVGASQCRACHEHFYELWSSSHHGKAMQAFSGAFARTLTPMTKPMRIGDKTYIIKLNDAGGVMQQTNAVGETKTYPVLHAMGGKNVYFFLVPLDKGKLQVAPLAYNVHTKAWFNATGSMVRHFNNGLEDAPLDWKDRLLTFNTACYDCHVSQLSKNYDPKTDSYSTTWKEEGINCESCHGPCEAHVKAANEALDQDRKLKDLKLISYKTGLNMTQRIAACAACHAKMTPLTDSFSPGQQFFDHFDLAGYDDPDFYPDGRDLGENYTQTGWMANPCANAGKLECIHCHTSSGRFRFSKNPNQSCLPCHKKLVDNIQEHSHHPITANVSCIDCHMPKTAHGQMTRSDHSFRSPSPKASLAFGSPNACNLCHNNKEAITGEFHGHKKKDIEWAMKYVAEWYGPDAGKDILKQGRIIKACRDNDWNRLPDILAYLDSPQSDQPSKVGILRMLSAYPYPYPDKWPVIRRQLKSEHEWVRAAAADALRYDDSPESTAALLNATTDRFRAVRIHAASALVGRDLSGRSKAEQKHFTQARDEYWQSLQVWPDRWSTYYNQGIYFDQQEKPAEALKAYAKAHVLRPDVIQPVINSAMDYARMGDNTNAYVQLNQALQIDPKSSLAHFNMALQEAEFSHLDKAESHLRAALENDPDMVQAQYNLGVLLCRDNKAEGFDWLKKAALAAPENWNYATSYLFFLNRDQRQGETDAFLKEVIATSRAAPQAFFALANNQHKEGKTGDAIATCREAQSSQWLSANAKQYAQQMEDALQTVASKPGSSE